MFLTVATELVSFFSGGHLFDLSSVYWQSGGLAVATEFVRFAGSNFWGSLYWQVVVVFFECQQFVSGNFSMSISIGSFFQNGSRLFFFLNCSEF